MRHHEVQPSRGAQGRTSRTLTLPPVSSNSARMRRLARQDEQAGLAVGNCAGFPLTRDKLPGENGPLEPPLSCPARNAALRVDVCVQAPEPSQESPGARCPRTALARAREDLCQEKW